MKYALLAFLLLAGPIWGRLTWVRDRNEAVAAGHAAYARGEAAGAARSFAAALAANVRRAADPNLALNLAHAEAQAGQFTAARATYGGLLAGSPAAVGSVARQQLAVLAARGGDVAQALGLLRQALLLDPRNASARYDFEILSDFLAQRPAGPKITPPAPSPSAAPKKQPKPVPDDRAAHNSQPATKPGTDRQGQVNQPEAAPSPATPPGRQPSPAGPPDPQRPAGGPGQANGGFAPGQGEKRPIPSGEPAGKTRGLDPTGPGEAPRRTSPGGPGVDAATPADQRLQTQRKQLRAMNLSPAQARQLLETLRAEEKQYLQQLARPTSQKPDPSKPTW